MQLTDATSGVDAPRFDSGRPSPSRPWQFGLRTLLLAMAVCGAMFAFMSVAGPLWSVVLVWFALLIVAHVAANAWGAKIPSSREARLTDDGSPPIQITRAAVQQSCGRATRLREQVSVRRTMIIAGGIGGLLGGIGGASALIAVGIGIAHLAGLAVGTISSCVIGGLLGFLTSTFVQITTSAVREAAAVVPPVEGRGK
jgi:hypothetical protein